MAIVSCPDCGKKLKIADTSVGKKVKGPCGHVFVAQGDEAAAPKPAPAVVAPEKVYVGCTECGSKLKVATTSLGKKMKCPKCSAIFLARLPDEAPAKKAPPPPAAEDDMDDLLSFAQADAAREGESDADNGDLFKNEPVKSRAQRKIDDEEEQEEEPRPKGKARPRRDEDEEPKGKKSAKPPRFGKDRVPAAPTYPSRLIPSLLVALMLLAFGGLVAAIFFDINVAKELGIPEAKINPKAPIKFDGKEKISEETKKELASFDGAWIVESAEQPGGKMDDKIGQKYVFAKGMVTIPEGEVLESVFEVDPSKNPKWIKLPTPGGVMSPGIYTLEGDTLRWCTALPKKENPRVPGPRPSKFDPAEGYLYVLKRDKKTDNAGKDKTDNMKDKDAAKDKDKSKDLTGKDGAKDKNVKDKDLPKDKDDVKDKDVKDKSSPNDGVEKIVKKLGGQVIYDDKAPGKPALGADFTATKITDADLKSLAELTQLRKLRLGSTKINGAGLKDLGDRLINLDELDLSFTQVDDAGVKELAAFKNLKVLSLLNAKISDEGLIILAQLSQLEELNVSQNKLTSAAIKELGALKALRRLELGNTDTRDDALKAIGELDQLETLVLHGTLITDEGLKDIGKLKKLQELRLSFNISDKGLMHLAELSELRKLVLNSSRVKDEGMKVVGGFAKLKELEMQFTGVSDAGMKEIAGLKQLEILNLTGTKVTDEGLKALATMTSLKRLILRNTKVSAEAVADLKKSLPDCQIYSK